MKQNILSCDNQLVRRAALGETAAFELLAVIHRPALKSLAMRMLRNQDDANDAVQETLVKAFRSIGEFDPQRPLRPWLSRICANCCIDAVRSHKRDGDPLEAYEHTLASTDSIEESAEESIDRGQIMDAVQRLPLKYRKIVFMRHFKHMDVNEIADALDKPEGTIKSWLFRARAMLKKDLMVAFG